MSQDKELQADFYKKIVDFCTKAIEPDFRFHITFGKTIYNLENSWQHLRTVDFRNLGLILLVSEKIVSNEITMGILDKNDVFVSLSEPQIIKLEQCLNMIFVKIEDITETTIEEFTNGNFTYFEV